MPLILGTNSIKDTGYDVDNSLRFNKGDDPSLSRSTGDGNERIGTFSFWMKSDDEGVIFRIYTDGNNFFDIGVDGNRQLQVRNKASGSYNLDLRTNQVFRDPSAWKHIFIVIDTTQSTESNRAKMFINGTQVTSFGASTYPSQNDDLFMNANSKTAEISGTSGVRVNGYLAEFVLIDGTVKAVTDFGEFDEDSGIWKPIDVSGLSGDKGVNGFYLDFEDSSALGNCAFGGTDFTVSNLTSIDQSIDTCTNNFATLNSLANLTGSPTFSEGNLKVAGDNSANHNWQTTFVVSSGKWYWELKDLTSSPDGSLLFYDQSISSGSHPGYGFVLNTRKKVINGSPTGSAIGSSAQNDIWSMALDLDNGKMFIARNGTYLESGDPANGTNPFIQTSDGLPSEGVFGGHVYNGSMELNFGSPPYSVSSGNTDGNGFGNFEYAPPSGYLALCTNNLNA